MKKLLLAAIIIIFSYTNSFSDVIFFKDNTYKKGRILQVKEHTIEYDPEGDIPFDVIPRKNVVKIVYDNGHVVKFQEMEKILKKKPLHENEIRTGGFLDSVIRISFIGALGGITGQIADKEHELFSNYKTMNAPAYDGTSLQHDLYNLGCELDVMLPAMKFKQKRGFDLTGIKIGIRARYSFNVSDNTIIDNYDDYGHDIYEPLHEGNLLTFHSWAAGPVINLVFSPRNDGFNFINDYYIMAGQVTHGEVKGAPAIRDAGYVISRADYYSSINPRSYLISIGFGFHIAINKVVPVIAGIGFKYTFANLKFNDKINIYNLDETKIHMFSLDFSIGFHF